MEDIVGRPVRGIQPRRAILQYVLLSSGSHICQLISVKERYYLLSW